MFKKGLSHADWAISFGIFLVAIISLFIFLKPGSQPVYQSETLLDIVENNLQKEIGWDIKEIPLFIEKCKPYTPAGSTETISATIKIEDKSKSWSYWIYDNLGNRIGDEIKCAVGGLNIDSLKIYLVRMHPKSKSVGEPKLELILNPSNDPKLDVKLGASESISGINKNWLNDLKKIDYKVLKKDWNYPDSRDFVIYVDNDFVLGKEPLGQISVFVNEWKTWDLDENGHKEEVLISMRVY